MLLYAERNLLSMIQYKPSI